MATHSSILAWRIPWTVHGVAKSQTQLSNSPSLHLDLKLFKLKGPLLPGSQRVVPESLSEPHRAFV